MLRKKAIWEQLTGEHITEVFIELIGEMFADFAQVRDRYLAAMDMLEKTQGEFCKAEMDAIDRQLWCSVLFAGMLGLKANLNHFIDPVARSFLDVDSEVYLREETAHRLPGYENAQLVREDFYARLSPAEQEFYGDVLEYTC